MLNLIMAVIFEYDLGTYLDVKKTAKGMFKIKMTRALGQQNDKR